MFKKGQGLSMNTIIIAALALLILVILSVLVITGTNPFSKTNDCETIAGAHCEAEADDCGSGETVNNFRECNDPDNSVCCMPIGAQED